MKQFVRNPVRWALVLLGFLLLGVVASKAQEQSAEDLVRLLSDRSDRPGSQAASMGLFSCGQSTENRAVALSLVKQGPRAITAIERELDANERRGLWGHGPTWLLLAYARLKGPSAHARLKRIETNANLSPDRRNLDSAIALSLTLTSFVSDSRPLVTKIRCTRGPEPRDPLDEFILAWLKGDHAWMESSLGPRGKQALNSMLEGRNWESLRATLWPPTSGRGLAVGYKFEISGPWSEPVEALEERSTPAGDARELGVEFSAETVFTDPSGIECGRKRIRFLKSTDDEGRERHFFDSPDLGDLLRLIAACAEK